MPGLDVMLADFTRFFPMSLASDASRYLVFAGALAGLLWNFLASRRFVFGRPKPNLERGRTR